jgi:C-terminal processing protease CtpA/Prc
MEARAAYGIEAVRRLPGNIGYMDVRMFGMTPESGVRIDAAVDLLMDTEALIIDLRENRGGGGEAMGVLISRLSSAPIARSARIWRMEDGAVERETPETPHRPAAKRYGKPVYVLTSGTTFSAAETFAYDLQASRRAIVVGAPSRGGANPMNRPLIELGSGFLAFVPNGRSENPITKASADGAGVQPDLRSAADEALGAAYGAALAALPEDGPQSERSRAKADPRAALASR